MTTIPPITSTDLPFPLFRRGKVRDVYDIGAYLLFVTTDRISAFDHILPNGIPYKGAILNSISDFWFRKTTHIIPNHLLTARFEDYPPELVPFKEILENRSMVVIKTQPIDVECVVRGYIAGSAWTEYCDEGTVSGIKLPKGLQLGDRLPSPIFSPAIKNHAGHDTNINFEHLRELVGDLTANALKSASEALFQFGSDWVSTRGLILADTKFEFGWLNKTLLLIDEALTPDSSRYWDQATYQPGQSPPSFDKQLVRDYLTSVWKEPEPIQALPESLINRVSERYLNGFQMITGTNLLP